MRSGLMKCFDEDLEVSPQGVMQAIVSLDTMRHMIMSYCCVSRFVCSI